MATQTHGSVAAMEFRRTPRINFRNIVEEFDRAFQMVDAQTRTLTWERDDIAVIDRDCLRVTLGWLPATEPGRRAYLVLCVGLRPGSRRERVEPAAFDYVVERITERMRLFLPFTAVLRGEAGQPVGAPLMEQVFELLHADPDEMPGDTHAPRRPENVWRDAEMDAYADMVAGLAPEWGEKRPRRDHAQGAAEMRAKGAAGSGQAAGHRVGPVMLARAEPTKPLRLTIHTLALSLCLYVPPVGAAMLTYTLLRDAIPAAT